jgi:hypothetical protein
MVSHQITTSSANIHTLSRFILHSPGRANPGSQVNPTCVHWIRACMLIVWAQRWQHATKLTLQCDWDSAMPTSCLVCAPSVILAPERQIRDVFSI